MNRYSLDPHWYNDPARKGPLHRDPAQFAASDRAPAGFPAALAKFLEEDTIQVKTGDVPADWYRAWRQKRALLAMLKRLGRAANYTLLALVIAGVLWIAAQIFVAFHSGRVRQILNQEQPQMRVTSCAVRNGTIVQPCVIDSGRLLVTARPEAN